MNIGHWCLPVQVFVRPVCVVFEDGIFEFISDGPNGICEQVSSVIEFFFEGSVSPFDAAVVGRFAWRQDDKFDGEFLAGGLEFGHELRSAIDLYGADRERGLLDKFGQEPFGRGCFGV